MNSDLLKTLAALAIFIAAIGAFIVLWCLMSKLISHFGWTRIARNHRATAKPSGAAFRCRSGRIRWARYNNCLNVTLAKEGIHLSVVFLFRIGHPPVLIPWDAVTDVQAYDFLFFRWVRLILSVADTEVTIQLPRSSEDLVHSLRRKSATGVGRGV